jgi:PIN domain nuclease of toxin-antitoxin system
VRLLLDTHTLIWAADATRRLGFSAQSALTDRTNERLASAATLWEIAIKVGHGKLTLSSPFRPWVETMLRNLVADILPIEIAHGEVYVQLPPNR